MRCWSPSWGRNGSSLFRQAWPGWRAWYVAHGGERGPSLAECEQALLRHMPELVPVWRRQVELAGGDALAARFLSFWCPPAYLIHCSQAVLPGHRAAPGAQLRSRPQAQRGHGAVQRLDWAGG